MKQPGILIAFIIFIAAVSFVLASEQYKHAKAKTVTLKGLNGIDSPGDLDGAGTLKYAVKAERSQICYELSVSNIAQATGARITDPAGTVVVSLQVPTNGFVKDCAQLDPDKIDRILKNPSSYYVSVENSEFPGGAIKSQLR